jgi:alpha/beta superfamily hydrolase
MPIRNLDLDGPAGPLEAALLTPPEAPLGTALLCHAHPLHGGTMHFKLLFRAAKVFQSAGYAALRFQFRGVGRSAGAFDGGRGEAEDTRAALDFLAREYEGLPIILGGFSFGAAVALRTGIRDERVSALVLMGLPVLAGLGIESAAKNPSGKPVLFIQGERDEFGGRPEIEEFVRSFEGPKRLVVVPGSGHLFSESTAPVEAALREWLRNRLI